MSCVVILSCGMGMDVEMRYLNYLYSQTVRCFFPFRVAEQAVCTNLQHLGKEGEVVEANAKQMLIGSSVYFDSISVVLFKGLYRLQA
jgi:hypothetical protein